MTLRNVPEWIDSWEDFRTKYNDALSELIGFDSVSNAGKGVDIAVVDTAYTAKGVAENLLVKDRRDLSPVGDQKQVKCSHGTRVLSVLAEVAPEAGYYLYRVKTARNLIQENKRRQDKSFEADRGELNGANKRILLAVEQAIEDDVDIINFSVGTHHPSCNNCVFEEAIEAAKEAGIAVIAAIGNDSDRRGNHVLCPALTEGVLSVGGIVNKCKADFQSHTNDRRIWADIQTEDSCTTRQGPFCSLNGCAPDYECNENRDEQWWDKNIRHFGGNPHVLAPVHRPEKRQNGVIFSPGTSFAAPITAGAVAQILGLKSELGVDIERVLKVIRDGGPQIQGPDGQSATLLDVTKSIQKLEIQSEPHDE